MESRVQHLKDQIKKLEESFRRFSEDLAEQEKIKNQWSFRTSEQLHVK